MIHTLDPLSRVEYKVDFYLHKTHQVLSIAKIKMKRVSLLNWIYSSLRFERLDCLCRTALFKYFLVGYKLLWDAKRMP